ncbi:MAG: T9SS type A sorting domain-containing protein, partial [Bacteroidia bacterium]|nr:T9SS type A sorting domain-containing protein [Bacteroidia bacterium]
TGKVVLRRQIQAGSGRPRLNIEALPDGVYVARVQNDELTMTGRFVKK